MKSESEIAQSCPTLSDPMDCSLPGSSVRGIFQSRVLEWGAKDYSAIKRNEALTPATMQMNAEHMMLRAVKRSQKSRYCMTISVRCPEQANL